MNDSERLIKVIEWKKKKKLDEKSSSSIKYRDLIIELKNSAPLFKKLTKNLAIRDNFLKYLK